MDQCIKCGGSRESIDRLTRENADLRDHAAKVQASLERANKYGAASDAENADLRAKLADAEKELDIRLQWAEILGKALDQAKNERDEQAAAAQTLAVMLTNSRYVGFDPE